MNGRKKPVIFLAFANEQDDRVKYLRKLPEEARRLRAALEAARDSALCTFELRANATADEIIDVFQKHRNQIAVFHFGGHANGYQLLLESSEGRTLPAQAAGLAEFFTQQNALQLVFLNGCSTQPQVQGLLDAGVSMVIATSQSIHDEVATEFATHFYEALAQGAGVAAAYHEAAASIRIKSHNKPGALYWSGATPEERWPWDLYIRDGAEKAGEWNLPEAVDNPLFGLPSLPKQDLPESPFRHLNWFAREHADVFFGRGRQIRDLYSRVTAEDSAPIILFYGQSGVGKSSLLAAGIVPRLEANYDVFYLRRDQQKGLLETVIDALPKTGKSAHSLSAWPEMEERLKKPCVIILDQVEEIYMRPRPGQPEEFEELAEGLQSLFSDPSKRPVGKLILSFRKEWLSEIEDQLLSRKLAHSKVVVGRLDRRGLIGAVSGPATVDRLKRQFGLTIEKGLAEIIADDLLEDRDSALAPTLQILLTKMWERARKKDEAHPHFDTRTYQRLKLEGLLLTDFVDQQLELLHSWRSEVVDSGLALDVLACHTSPLGTAAQRSGDELERTYRYQGDILRSLLQQCKDLYLLVDVAEQSSDSRGTRLAHDTLAPLIRNRFDESDKPGQRARRILENRAVDWRGGKEGTPLDIPDLAAVERGQRGMRVWSDDEKHLITSSRRYCEQIQAKAEKQRKKIQFLGKWASIASVVLFVLLGVTLIFYSQATKQALLAESHALAATAISTLSTDPERSIEIALQATAKREEANATISQPVFDALQRSVATSRVRQTLGGHDDGVTGIAFTPDGRSLVTTSLDGTAKFWDVSTRAVLFETPRQKEPLLSIAIAPTGTLMATADSTGMVNVWPIENPEKKFPLSTGAPVVGLAFSPNAKRLATSHGTGTARVWDLSLRGEILSIAHGGISNIAFSPDGTHLATGGGNNEARIWDADNGKPVLTLEGHHGDVQHVAYSADGLRLVTSSLDFTAKIWDAKNGTELQALSGHSNAISSAGFGTQGRLVVTASADGTARIWDARSGAQLLTLAGHGSSVTSVAVDPKASRVATASLDGTAKVWTTAAVHSGFLNGVAFNHDGTRLATASDDGTVKILDALSEEELQTLGDRAVGVKIHAVTFDRDGQLVAAASENNKVSIWRVSSGELLRTLDHDNAVYDVTFGPNGLYLATASGKSATLWEISTWKPIGTFPHDDGDVIRIDFDPNGSRMATASSDRTVRLWDVESGTLLGSPLYGHEDLVFSAVFSPDGKRLATASADGTVKIWDTSSTEDKLTLSGPSNAVTYAMFSPDGALVAAASWDRSIWIWNASTGEELWRITHTNPVNHVAFSPDGRRLASAGGDYEARIYVLELDELVALAKERITH